MKTWDTNSLPPADRLPYWREVLCEAFTALTTEPQDAPERRSIVTLKEFGEVNGVALTSFSQVINHGPAEVRRSQDAFFFVNYQLQGDCRAEQDGRATCAGPGQFYVVDTRRPYRLDFTEGFQTLSFRFPMRQLAPLLGDPRRVTACSIDQRTPLGGLAASHMRDVLRCARDLPPEASRSLAETLGRLIGLAIGQMPQDDPASREKTRAVFHDSIVQYMRDHSTEPDLSLASVAARFRMSPRTLQAALAARGSSFTEVVLDARLDMASRALTRAGARVTQVAYDCGFGDLSYFGRAFRRRYGCAPRDWQRDRTSQAPRPAAPDLR